LVTTDFAYCGQELSIFAHAKQWKTYWSETIRSYLGKEVLEVGAGTGSNTEILCSARQNRWLCLEPDQKLLDILTERVRKLPFSNSVEARLGTIQSLTGTERFDTVIYSDVLEHIEDDRAELEFASHLLSAGGHLVVLAPAYEALFSPFDRAIGHFRRYTKRTLVAIGPSQLRLERVFYLDAVGLLASLGNRLLLRQSIPTIKQIEFWDGWLVPLSRKIDPCLRYGVGKTLIGVWRRSP
jgi:ubiquinone/menaquinone biosynthesis C-methylase UbiE